jgi:hypothetical protein
MGKKIWLMVLLFALGILVGLGATTVFAQGPTTTQSGNTAGVDWQQMQQACANGDYEAMQKLHDEYCGGQNGTTGGMMGPNGTNSMMGNGGGMMGGGRGGMMGNW